MKKLIAENPDPIGVSLPKLSKMVKYLVSGGKIKPMVIGDNYRIMDGAHRAAAYTVLQKSKIKVRIVDL